MTFKICLETLIYHSLAMVPYSCQSVFLCLRLCLCLCHFLVSLTLCLVCLPVRREKNKLLQVFLLFQLRKIYIFSYVDSAYALHKCNGRCCHSQCPITLDFVSKKLLNWFARRVIDLCIVRRIQINMEEQYLARWRRNTLLSI